MNPRPGRWHGRARLAIASASIATALAGCAGREARRRELLLEPLLVQAGSPEQVALAALNVEELFSLGLAAHARGDYERAARAFEAVIAGHPRTDRLDDAHFNAGLSWERMGESLRALQHFLPLLDRQTGEAWTGAALRAADNLYHLEAYGDAARLLHLLARRSRADPNLRIEALVKEGVCLLESGHIDEAEQRLRMALGRYQIERRRDETEVDTLFPAQGQFFLAEVYRLRFEASAFDTTGALPELAAELGEKGALLLSAQGHYLRAIRMGEARWAAASGYELGRLYEVFHDQITRARAPSELRDPTERLAYQQLLEREVRALLEKALAAYERTLSASTRVGVQGRWRERIKAGLARVRALLLSELPDAEAPGDDPPARGTEANVSGAGTSSTDEASTRPARETQPERPGHAP